MELRGCSYGLDLSPLPSAPGLSRQPSLRALCSDRLAVILIAGTGVVAAGHSQVRKEHGGTWAIGRELPWQADGGPASGCQPVPMPRSSKRIRPAGRRLPTVSKRIHRPPGAHLHGRRLLISARPGGFPLSLFRRPAGARRRPPASGTESFCSCTFLTTGSCCGPIQLGRQGPAQSYSRDGYDLRPILKW